MAKAPKMEMKCEKCGKPQPKDDSKSNENWNAFRTGQRCECGGEYKMYIDGKKLG